MSETETAPEAPVAPAAPEVAAPTPTEPAPAAAKPEPPKPAPPAATGPTQAQVDELQRKLDERDARLKEVNAESAGRRKELDAIKREQETAQEKAIREAVELANEANKPRIVKAEARVALSAADARPERIAALTRFLEMDKISVDGDNVTGLDDQITTLKAEYPEFFKTGEPAEPVKPLTPKIPVGNKPPADKPRTIGERIAADRGTQ
jgi:hypothetical protein